MVMYNAILVAAFVAACGAAKLDRTYLPPSSSQYAGGAPGSLQTPFITTGNNQGLQTLFGRTSDNNPSQVNQIPSGSYENEHQGVVVDAAAPGTRASNQPSGLGGPRENYGSTDSKVGEAAFRGTKNQARPNINEAAFQTQTHGPFDNQGTVDINNQDYPDLSAFYQPSGQVNTGYKPGNQLFTDRVPNTIKYHINIGLNKYNYGFDTENGIKMQESGVSSDGVTAQGGYSYTGDDGKVYSVVYTADKDGYRPMGSHLPTPPPIPLEIQESLQQNARDEANGIKDDGSYDAEKYNTEDDNAQSDTNGNYYDRQSNKFEKRPASNAGPSTVINQDQQAFVRPNVQGQFNSDDYSKDSSSTQPDISKFGSSVSGFNNKGQFHSFGEQHGSNPTSAVTNQNQKGFVQQNVPGQFSSYDSSKDSSSAQTAISKETSISGFENSSNKGNILAQDAQTTQFNNRFGDQFQFSAPPGYFQNANPLLEIDSSKVGFNNNFHNAQPNSEQKYQRHESIGKPVSSIRKSCCTSSGQGSSYNQQTPFSQISNSFGMNSNKNTPNDAFSQLGLQTSLIGSDLGFEIGGNVQNSPEVYSDGSFTNSVSSQEVNNNSPQNQGPEPILNFGIIPAQNNLNISPQTQQLFSQTAAQGSDNRIVEKTNPDLINRFSASFFSQDVQTKQPELTLSTPLYSHPQKTNSGFPEIETSLTDPQPQKPYYLNFGNSQSIQIPSAGQFNTFSGQPLGPDGSFIYNIPSDHFKAPTFTNSDSNKNSGITSSLVNSVTRPLGSLFPNASEGSVFSVQHQGGTGSTQYPQLSEAPIAPTLATQEVDTEKNTFQSNGITQASVSSFPSITPTSTSQINSEMYEYTKPVQGLPTSSVEQITGESNSRIKPQSIEPFSQKEDTITPQVHADSNSQFGHRFSTSSTSSLGQQATSSRFGIQASAIFGQKPSQLQFGAHESSGQTSALFGQKPTQQQFSSQPSFLLEQKITPFPFSTQTNSPFTQKVQTLSPFGGQTSTSLNQQTTPTGLGIQTSSSFGQIPSQPQTSFSFGQQTPSRFGGQTSSLFGQKPILSPFGAQTTSPFSQAQTQPQTSFSFGQQSAPSRFGVQTSSIFGQNPTQVQTGGPTSFSFGAQTTPSRFGPQIGSLFEQKPNLPLFGTFLNKQTTTRFESSFGQQITPSRNDIQTNFGQNLTQPQLSGQTSFSFGQTIPSRIGDQINPSFGQQTGSVFEKTNEPNKNTSSDEIYQYNKPTTDFLSNEGNKGQTDFRSQQINSQLGQQITDSHEKNEVKIEQQITVQPDKQFDSQPLQSATKPNLQFGVQTESTSADEELSASQEIQDGTHFDSQAINQSNKQSFSSSIQNDDASKKQSQIPIQSRFSEQTNSPFGSLQLTTSQFVAPTGLLEQSFNIEESTTSEFSSTSLDNTQYQPSSPSSPNSFNLQKQEQSLSVQNSTQSLPDSSEEEKSRFGENIQQEKITEQSGQNKLDTDKDDDNQLSTQDSDVSQNQTDSNSQTASLGALPSSHPFPQFAFYSACCRGSKPQNNQGSQALSGNLGSNIFGFNKNNNQDNKGSGLIENKFGIQGSVVKEPADSNGFGIQKDTPNFIEKGEEFGGPREPPKFDETGYHY